MNTIGVELIPGDKVPQRIVMPTADSPSSPPDAVQRSADSPPETRPIPSPRHLARHRRSDSHRTHPNRSVRRTPCSQWAAHPDTGLDPWPINGKATWTLVDSGHEPINPGHHSPSGTLSIRTRATPPKLPTRLRSRHSDLRLAHPDHPSDRATPHQRSVSLGAKEPGLFRKVRTSANPVKKNSSPSPVHQ